MKPSIIRLRALEKQLFAYRYALNTVDFDAETVAPEGSADGRAEACEVLSRAAEVLPDKRAPWLVYCRTGRRSADAVQKLASLGYENLYDLGGILSWPYEIEGDFEGHF